MRRHLIMLRSWPRLSVSFLFIAGLLGLSPPPLWADTTPLPDSHVFLAQVKKKLVDGAAMDLSRSYTYRKKVVEETLKTDNRVKSSVWKEYEVFPAKEGSYTRLVSKNGVPLSAQELKKQDDEQADKERKRAAREAKISVGEQQAKADQKRKDRQERIDDVFNAYHFTLLGRERVDGRPALVVAFTPKADASLKSRTGKMVLKKIAGKAWIEENEHALIKVVLEAIDNITLGAGLLAKVDKGMLITQEWRKINDEIWLPARTDMRLKAKVLMAKGLNQHRLEEYSDYKKYSVNTQLRF